MRERSQKPLAIGCQGAACLPATIFASASIVTGMFFGPSATTVSLASPDAVGEQPMAFVDDVVVVRDRLARLDRTVLRGGHVRGLAAEEQRRVERQLVAEPFFVRDLR